MLAVSIIGINFIKISGRFIDDMPRNTEFFDDIIYYDNEFNGILPLEIYIDLKRKKGVINPAIVENMQEIEDVIENQTKYNKYEKKDESLLSRPISVISLLKYTKQAYFNGNPKYYQLPNKQDRLFISAFVKKSSSDFDLLNNYVDSTGRYTRITTFMKDIETEDMERIEVNLEKEINKIIDKKSGMSEGNEYNERAEVFLTGKAYLFQKGTYFLVENLVWSLGLAIFLISLFMAYLFRNFRMIIISLIPNLLPLLITAGLMGFIGIPIKPSTILIFSIAFGISVDDTIHFLAKYRQELQDNKWQIKKSVYNSVKETGLSMFYTSVVLFFGFSVFIVSNFGGTIALGALVSTTLLLAMLSNLLLLPSLLMSLEKSIANEKVLKEPKIKILSDQKEL